MELPVKEEEDEEEECATMIVLEPNASVHAQANIFFTMTAFVRTVDTSRVCTLAAPWAKLMLPPSVLVQPRHLLRSGFRLFLKLRAIIVGFHRMLCYRRWFVFLRPPCRRCQRHTALWHFSRLRGGQVRVESTWTRSAHLARPIH